MPTTIIYPLLGEPARLANGVLGHIEGDEDIEDGRTVLANVNLGGDRAILAVPVAWDATQREWRELTEPHAP